MNVTTRTGEDIDRVCLNVTTRTTGKAGKCERMDSPLSLEVVQCRQFDPVTRPFTMNERSEYISYYLFIVSGDTEYLSDTLVFNSLYSMPQTSLSKYFFPL